MSHLTDENTFDDYESHPGKPLKVHTAGVTGRVVARTKHLDAVRQIAYIAAKLHDVGKINPNFQKKLYPSASGWSLFQSCLSLRAGVSSPFRRRAGNLCLALTCIKLSALLCLLPCIMATCVTAAKIDARLKDSIDIELGDVLKERPYDEAKKFVLAHPDLAVYGFCCAFARHRPAIHD